MTLIVEDGTGKEDAESYASVAYADAYFAGRGVAEWAALSTGAKEQALRKASDYMGVYSSAWRGRRKSVTQGLDWPRIPLSPTLPASSLAYANVVQTDNYPLPLGAVPVRVVRACCILALKSTAGDLLPDMERAVHSKTVGPITTVYDDFSPQTKRYASVDNLVAPYLLTTGYGLPLRRA